MGKSEEADSRSSEMETPSENEVNQSSEMERSTENEVKQGHIMAPGSSERLADQFLLLGLPLESEVIVSLETFQR